MSLRPWLLFGLSVALLTAATVEGRPQPQDKAKRLSYVVKHADARDLAATLTKYFKGDDVIVLADNATNTLLVGGPQPIHEELGRLLPQLDRPALQVTVDVIIAEVASVKPGGAGKDDFDEKALSGPAAEVLERVKTLEAKKVLAAVRRVQLVATENLPATVKVKESKPYVTGFGGFGGKGKGTSTINYRDVGTVVQATARVSPARVVALDVRLDDSRLSQSEAGAILGQDDNGNPIRATEFVNLSVDARLSVPAGQAVLAQGLRTTGKGGQDQSVVIVVVRVAEPGGK